MRGRDEGRRFCKFSVARLLESKPMHGMFQQDCPHSCSNATQGDCRGMLQRRFQCYPCYNRMLQLRWQLECDSSCSKFGAAKMMKSEVSRCFLSAGTDKSERTGGDVVCSFAGGDVIVDECLFGGAAQV
jgi:hypothetical protein